MPSSQSPSIAGISTDPTADGQALGDAEVVRIAPAELREKLLELRREGCSMLLDIGGVDYLAREPRYDVAYHLLALPGKAAGPAEIGRPRRVRVLVGVPAGNEVVPSVADLWPSADWPEREIFDLYGIRFEGHPDLRRIQMPDDWTGHPLRKDYPVRGPAAEATPRPPFASKSNVPAGTPPSGKVAAALQKQIARVRGASPPSGDGT